MMELPNFARLLSLSFVLVLACGCGGIDVTADTAATDASGADELAELATSATARLKARINNTSLWVDEALGREQRDGREVFVLRGRTSRTLLGGLAFVCDDVYGEWLQRSPRIFEVTWAVSEAAGLVSGVNQFVRLDFRTKPEHVFARTNVGARLGSVAGTGASLDAQVTPVVANGRTVFRMTGAATEKIYHLTIQAGGTYLDSVRQLADSQFQADLSRDQLLALAGSDGEVVVTARLLNSTEVVHARLTLVAQRLDLTTADPYEVWPGPTCSQDVKACLAALPADSLDLSACGEARDVLACSASIGATVDNDAIQAALGRADALLTDAAGFASDGTGLVGADSASALSAAVRSKIETELRDEYAVWYLSPLAVAAVLDRKIALVIDNAYATPLELVAPHAPLAGDLDRTRQVAADALLSYLATHDTRTTEWGRPLVELTRTYRQWHVRSLRYFREQATPVVVGETTDTFVGDWLGALVEITVDRATGTVVNILLEVG